MATLLSIVQDVQDELGLPRASAVVSASTQTERQMLALLNREGQALVKACEWPKLITEATITTVNGTSDYAVPSDFDRQLDQTSWDRTNGWEMIGPELPQVDKWIREGTAAEASTRRRYRYIGGYFRIYPTPTADGEVLVYDYVSKNWCESSGGTGKVRMTLDTDVPRLDEELLKLGLKWRFLSTKGFDATQARAEYEAHKSSLMASDKGGGPLNMEGFGGENILVDMSDVPDAGYGS